MRPSKSAYIVASLAFAFLPPGRARGLALILFLILAGIFIWAWNASDVVIGQVTNVLMIAGSGDALIGMQPLATGPGALQIPAVLMPANPIMLQDIVFAHGQEQVMPESIAYLEVGRIGVLQVSSYHTKLTALWDAAKVSQTSPVGIAMAAALMVIFAPILLRFGAAAVMALLSGLISFLLLQINAGEILVPIPPLQVEGLVMAGAVIGAVIGYKALIEDPTRIGERVIAMIFALPMLVFVATLLAEAGLVVPEPLLWAIPLLASIAPVITPVLAALLLVTAGLDLAPVETAIVGTVMFGARFIIAHARRQSTQSGVATLAPFQPETDARGEFDLGQILNARKGD